MESATSTSCLSAASATSVKAATSFSMSTLAMYPPRVSQRMGQVGLPALYSPGQAKVKDPTAPTPIRLAISMQRTSSARWVRKPSCSVSWSFFRSVRWICLKVEPALSRKISRPWRCTLSAMRSASASLNRAISASSWSLWNQTDSTPISLAVASAWSKGSWSSGRNIPNLNRYRSISAGGPGAARASPVDEVNP